MQKFETGRQWIYSRHQSSAAGHREHKDRTSEESLLLVFWLSPLTLQHSTFIQTLCTFLVLHVLPIISSVVQRSGQGVARTALAFTPGLFRERNNRTHEGEAVIPLQRRSRVRGHLFSYGRPPCTGIYPSPSFLPVPAERMWTGIPESIHFRGRGVPHRRYGSPSAGAMFRPTQSRPSLSFDLIFEHNGG